MESALAKEQYDEIMSLMYIRMWAGLERKPDGVWADADGNEYSKPGTYQISEEATLTIKEGGEIEVVCTKSHDKIDEIDITKWDVDYR